MAFYRVYDSQEVTLPEYRCYLNKFGDNAAKCLKFPDMDKPTGIETVVPVENKNVDVFTTSGVMVRSNVNSNVALDGLPSGVYIINNKKVIKK